jgi:hypothetical protein
VKPDARPTIDAGGRPGEQVGPSEELQGEKVPAAVLYDGG